MLLVLTCELPSQRIKVSFISSEINHTERYLRILKHSYWELVTTLNFNAEMNLLILAGICLAGLATSVQTHGK